MVHFPRSTIQLCVTLLIACGSAPAPDDSIDTVVAHESAINKSERLYCGLIVHRVMIAGSPPVYSIMVEAVNCGDPRKYIEIGRSIGHDPVLALVESELGVVATYTQKQSISGSSPITLGLVHVEPTSLTIVRRTNLAVPFGAGNVYSGTPLVDEDGTTLLVSGTKSGVFQGEVGNSNNYAAIYADFFTSTKAPTIYTY
ncbi:MULTISPECIES: hypothetical protein [Myxococcus]|uniref:hypothetical protein n=1 Tax=Myxococcus TaxID=32 RepID=UPI001142E579|nr:MULTISPECIES: hypothetical protein [Myxococcus]